MDNMRSVQEIFNLVVVSGYYPKQVNNLNSNDFMCNALYDMWRHQNITTDEYRYVKGVVNDYIGNKFSTLADALKANSLPATAADRLAIYKNWVSRPVLSTE